MLPGYCHPMQQGSSLCGSEVANPGLGSTPHARHHLLRAPIGGCARSLLL
ncbi:rCG48767 [Rattus norvegicus]|uniref:RCG48767 n=1 Tax=Rattus norvegicus TaxID=10116 RepID=A6IFL2_RAT|nr:rCG48767 [Rattus norvegicus]